jgi:hypothetical protein
LGNVPVPPLGYVPTDAVLTLAPGASLNDYLQAHQVHVVSTLELPASGSTPATTDCLIRANDGSQVNLQTLGPEEGGTVSPNNRIDEGDRGGESFDDNDSRRDGGAYLNQPAITKVKIPQARAITQGLGEIVAILDTGIDPNHSLFVTAPNQANIILAQNYTVFPPDANVLESRNNQDDDEDGGLTMDSGMGHVAGIVYTGRGSHAPDFEGPRRRRPRSAFGLAMAIRAAADYGAHVINLSLRLTALIRRSSTPLSTQPTWASRSSRRRGIATRTSPNIPQPTIVSSRSRQWTITT